MDLILLSSHKETMPSGNTLRMASSKEYPKPSIYANSTQTTP